MSSLKRNPDFLELHNDHGLQVYILPFSATLAGVVFPDRDGNPTDLVLGFDSKAEYERDKAFLGRTVGRVANRIKNGRFEFGSVQYELEKNLEPHHIHGGSKGVSFREWEVVRKSTHSVTLNIRIAHESDGYPGDANISVTYTVNDRNQLIVEHFATCQEAGILALTNHAYWNLDGMQTIHDHSLEVAAPYYLPVDETCCPTGAILSVNGTEFDFRSMKKLSTTVDKDGNLTIDNDLVLNSGSPLSTKGLRLRSDQSGIEMDVQTSYPVIHLYASGSLDCIGRGRTHYGKNKALAVEAQFHSASVNFKNFSDISLRPGQDYSEEIVYSFSIFD